MILADAKRAPRVLLDNIFRLNNYETMQAEDEDEVIQLYRKNLDTHMILASSTISDSFDRFAKRIKENSNGSRPIIISMIDEDIDDDLLHRLKENSDGVIYKPIKQEILESTIELYKEEMKNGFNGDDFDPISELKEEHRLLERFIESFQLLVEKMHGKTHDKILKWMKETVDTVERKMHHKKEMHYMVYFLEKAIAEQGEEPDDKLFNRASLKSVQEEHEKINDVFGRLRDEIDANIAGESDVASLKVAVDDYGHLMKEHIKREERFLYPNSSRYLDDEIKRKLRVEFLKEEKKVGKNKLKKLENQLSRVEMILGRES